MLRRCAYGPRPQAPTRRVVQPPATRTVPPRPPRIIAMRTLGMATIQNTQKKLDRDTERDQNFNKVRAHDSAKMALTSRRSAKQTSWVTPRRNRSVGLIMTTLSTLRIQVHSQTFSQCESLME